MWLLTDGSKPSKYFLSFTRSLSPICHLCVFLIRFLDRVPRVVRSGCSFAFVAIFGLRGGAHLCLAFAFCRDFVSDPPFAFHFCLYFSLLLSTCHQTTVLLSPGSHEAGRKSSNPVFINHKSVSRLHAVITVAQMTSHNALDMHFRPSIVVVDKYVIFFIF